MKPKVKCAAIAISALLSAQSLPFAPYSVNAADFDYVVTENILSGAEYTFTNKLSGKLITADADGNVLQRSAGDNQLQKWQIIKVDEKYCRFVCANDRTLALTVDDAATPNGSNISVAKYTGADTQLFQIKHDNSAYYITTKCSNDASAIDVKGKSSAEDANIHHYKYQGNDNQLFDIVPVDNEYSWIRGDLNLDGENPSIICWTKNRNKDKSFNSLITAYSYDKNGKFGLQWKYDNKKSYAEAHQIRVADVNYDGKDEVLHMGYALNEDGSLRYTVDKVVHGDRWYVGSFCNNNNGKEMMHSDIYKQDRIRQLP